MAETNRKWVLAARPAGLVGPECFEWREDPVPAIADGQFLVRNLWLSCDPAQRAWMERDTYIPMLPLGEVMLAATGGQVIESHHPDFQPGDYVSAALGWQDYAVSDGSGLAPPLKIPPGVDLPTALSLFGITGLTAYFGLLDVGQPKDGDTVVVSGSAGAVGSIVVQIARIKGARVIGIAGGVEKCEWVLKELGADDVIDYKHENVGERLRALCPNGIDVYFDNVGGETLDAALARLALHARVVLCGAISEYNAFDERPGLRNTANLIVRRARMEGFLVLDYMPRALEAVGDLAGWAAAGEIKNQIDVVEGLENAPAAFQRLFTGANLGKQLVHIADPPL